MSSSKEYAVREGARFELRSEAFEDGGIIPVEYTCDGRDVSPPLEWGAPPSGTRSLALIMYDPDAPAGTFVHWVLYNIPAGVTRLPKGLPGEPVLEGYGLQGRNDFGRIGYGGPCPPRWHGEHRYYFALHALSVDNIGLGPGATADRVLEAIRGRVVGHAIMMGRYSRSP